MSNFLNPSGMANPVMPVTALGEVIFEGIVKSPKFSSLHNVITNIPIDRKVQIMPRLARFLSSAADTCDPITGTSTVNPYELTWEPVKSGIFLKQCFKDLLKSASYFLVNYKNVNKADLINSPEFMKYVGMILSPDAFDAEYMIDYWLQDTAYIAADFTTPIDPSLGLTSYTDFYTKFDGFWAQIIANGKNVSAFAPDVALANSQPTYELQVSSLTATAGKDALEALRSYSDTRLKTDRNAYYVLTTELFENYRTWLDNQVVAPAWAYIQNGKDYDRVLAYHDRLVYAQDAVSMALTRDFRTAPTNGDPYDPADPSGAGWRVNNLHRAGFVTKDNLAVCFDGDRILYGAELEYNPNDRTVQIVADVLTDCMPFLNYMSSYVI